MIDTTYMFDGTFTAAGVPSGVAITATRDSTNILDLLAARDLGADAPLTIRLAVMEAFATLTSLQVSLSVSPTTVGGTYYQIMNSPVYPVAQLILGAPIFRFDFPLNQLLNGTAGVLNAPAHFAKLVYTVAGSNATAGKVMAWLAPIKDRPQFTVYPNNYVAAVASGEI